MDGEIAAHSSAFTGTLGHADLAHDNFAVFDRLAAEARQSADDRGVISIGTVAVQFFEIGKQAVDVILCVRPLRMTRMICSAAEPAGLAGALIWFFAMPTASPQRWSAMPSDPP